MDDKIRLISIGHSYVVSLNRSILRELAKDPDFEVTIGAPTQFQGSLRSIEMEEEPADSNIKLVPIRTFLTKKMHVFFYHPTDLGQLFKNHFDCAHFWEEPYILSGFQLGQAAAKNQVPFLFRTAQSLIKNYVFPFQQFEKSTLKKASYFVAGGHLVHQAMRDKGWEKPGQVITLAVDTEAFKPLSDEEKHQGQAKLGLKAPVIGYLGRLSEEKGCDLFMEVLSELKKLPWSFLVMGSGPYEQKIKSWAKENKIEDRVQVKLLKHDEVPKHLPLCDLLICPSQTRSFWKEQFGRMIVEAFASGVPVIGSDSGEIPRVIADAGLILKEDDKSAWKQSLESFLKNPKSFDHYKEKGLKRVHQYSAKAIAEQYKTIYKNLANKTKLEI